jgi:hypothetical protein
MDILSPILDIYDTKKEVLLFYLDESTRDQVEDFRYLDDDNELFLNDKIFCIDRATLTLDHIGIIQAIKDHKITIKVKGGYSKHLPEVSYHIFIKRRRCKQNDRDFYKALLNSL